MKYIQEQLRNNIYNELKDDFPISLEEIQFTIPPQRSFGDLSTTIPFTLAKTMKQKPFVIGNAIIEKLKDKLDICTDIKLERGGFINFFFKPNYLLRYMTEHASRRPSNRNIKMVVEHTSINPNKSAHIGHLRNACLGDTLANCLSYLGYEVEIQNYLDDTGIQVADVVWGLMYYKKLDLAEIKKIDNLASHLWYLYPEVSTIFAENEAAKKERDEVHKKIEEKIEPEYSVNDYVAGEVLKDHIRCMNLLGIRYDLLVRESDIIQLNFFKDARQLMEEKNVLYASNDPEKKGCMVIKYEKENIEKIVIRSNGTITYIGKDIAYTLWKVGLFDREFFYRPFYAYDADGKEIFITDHIPHPIPEGYHFGGGESVYNVIDVRQSYLQNIIGQILGPLSPPDHQRKFIHFSYEMVALTPRCVEELGFQISDEDRKKPYVEVSGRKGIAVKADDLIDKLTQKSLEEVKIRHTELPDEEAIAIARDIAIGALRYFMIKFSSNSVIAFDFQDALAFEGDTGPYLQYTLVRINSILRKLEEAGGFQPDQPLDTNMDMSLLDAKEYEKTYEMLLELSILEQQVELAMINHELSVITSYTYSLCQKFNNYYHHFPILKENNDQLRQLRLQTLLIFKKKLEHLLAVMGIPAPVKM